MMCGSSYCVMMCGPSMCNDLWSINV